LPASELFADEKAYSFRDLVSDGRNRVSAVLKKLQVAHLESHFSYFLQTIDVVGWDALNGAWNLAPTNVAPAPLTYFTTTEALDVPKVLELLRICQDTFIGLVENLKASVPTYLEQSLGKFPWHDPQNGLFLAFMQLFDYAKLHINRLGRKHLLYYYEDVLRFTARSAVPDQASLIFQLRKGVARHLIEAGTLLKAGKDSSGKALYYEVLEENVLNQATVASLKNVYVERVKPIASAPPYPVTTKVVNIYASPIANSADGIGADLDKDEPKWNMFGEPQSLLASDAHTMPDAQLGFAVASPLLVLHEGHREVLMTFVMTSLPADIGEYVLPNNDNAIAAREYAILHGLKAEYTMEKGWAEARISQVFLTTTQLQLDRYNSVDPTVVLEKPSAAWNFTSGFLLTIRLVIDEHSKACLPYNENVHEAGMNTKWPVMRLTFKGQSRAVEPISIPAFLPGLSQANLSLHLFGGQLYKYTFVENIETEGDVKSKAFAPTYKPSKITELTQITLEEALNIKYPAYVAATQYLLNATVQRVIWDNVAYELIASYPNGTTLPAPTPPSSTYWKLVDFNNYVYDYLQYFLPVQVMLRVDVTGINGVVLENDASKLKSNKPFQPFGAVPTIGSRFYIGSQEIFGKKLSKLSVSLKWQDMPNLLGTYFAKYATTAPTNDSWLAAVGFLYEGKWQSLGSKTIFHTSAASSEHVIEFAAASFTNYLRDLSLVEPTKLDPTTVRGFLRFELTAPSFAFGHKAYRDIYVKEAYRAAAAMAGKPTASASTVPDFPNEPFAPTIKDFSISYSSRADIDFGIKSADATSYNSRVEQFFHIHPFGHTEEHPYLWKTTPSAMVPKLPEEGYLYLGIDGLEPPSTLSLLYQLVEGSGNPDLDLHVPAWSFLSSNKWVDLDPKDLLSDSTSGMITSGVIRYNFKSEMNVANTVLDSSMHWLRAKVDVNVPANLKAIEILAQAVTVRFADQGNNLDHLAKSMPASTINGLKINDPEVKKVDQPYSSIGGKLPEQSDAFLTRVSERLRHKQRSINVWDYERIVLEQFPEIYKVKCLNHTELQVSGLGGADLEISPGYVTVICIPDLRNRNAVNPFEPKTSVHTLKSVTDYLRKYASAWVDLRVANPLYEQLKITCKVGFVVGKDPGFYIGQLETAIQQFLSPWAFDHQEEIVFGSSVHRSQIIRFIEQQDYVDYVISFSMDHIKGAQIDANVDDAKATTGRSIIVSALKHVITSGDATCADCESPIVVVAGQVTCCSNPCCHATD
jgi:Baseplate J-like protein